MNQASETKKESGKKTDPITFVKQVRAEMRKVTWPTRKETTVSTFAVFIMVVIASIFLFVADQIIAWAVQLIMSIGL